MDFTLKFQFLGVAERLLVKRFYTYGSIEGKLQVSAPNEKAIQFDCLGSLFQKYFGLQAGVQKLIPAPILFDGASFYQLFLRKAFFMPSSKRKKNRRLRSNVGSGTVRVRNRIHFKKADKRLPQITIRSNFSNTLITIADPLGQVVRTFTCGQLGFTKSKRSTYYASLQLGTRAATYLMQESELKAFVLRVRGFGFGRKAALRGFRRCLALNGLKHFIYKCFFDYSVPHNGCRVRKYKRR